MYSPVNVLLSQVSNAATPWLTLTTQSSSFQSSVFSGPKDWTLKHYMRRTCRSKYYYHPMHKQDLSSNQTVTCSVWRYSLCWSWKLPPNPIHHQRHWTVPAIQASIKSSPLWQGFTVYTLDYPHCTAGNPEYTAFVNHIREDYDHPMTSLHLIDCIITLNEAHQFLFPLKVLHDPFIMIKQAFLHPLNSHVNEFNKNIPTPSRKPRQPVMNGCIMWVGTGRVATQDWNVAWWLVHRKELMLGEHRASRT